MEPNLLAMPGICFSEKGTRCRLNSKTTSALGLAMFSVRDIKKRLRQQPFLPVRVVTTTGQTYDVRHPEMVIVGRNFLMIGSPTKNDASVAEEITRVALLHVT